MSRSRIGKMSRSIGRSIGLMPHHKYRSIKNLPKNVNELSNIKPNEIKFSSIQLSPGNSRKSVFNQLHRLKNRGIGSISYKRGIKSANKSARMRMSPLYENESNFNSKITNLETRLKKLKGSTPTEKELKKRYEEVFGKTMNIDEFKRRLNHLHGLKNTPEESLKYLMERFKNL